MNGNVSRRQNGEWEYRFDIGPDRLTGSRRRRTKSGFPTKREATAAMREAIRQHERGRSVSRSKRTISDFLDTGAGVVGGRADRASPRLLADLAAATELEQQAGA